jgi:3-methyl-2-oxobutanoate hydroxymethyltransferase
MTHARDGLLAETMASETRRAMTARDIAGRKGGQKLVMIAAYDNPTARLVEQAGIDIILVGDSLGMAFQGNDSTVPVTVDDIVYHTRVVKRGAQQTHVVADLPFLSYQQSNAQALASAARLMQEGGADSVKLEGGVAVADRIRALVTAGIPVCAHIGLTPQSAGVMGGFRVQGRDLATAKQLISDAEAVAEAGAYAVVLEMVPAELGAIVTQRIGIPTIGIGAGVECDGQVLVAPDILGIDDRFSFKFVRRYADIGKTMSEAFAAYAADVRSGAFPGPAESYVLKPEVIEALTKESS